MEAIEKIKAKSKDEQLEMAKSPETPEQDLVLLAQVGNHRVRKVLASRKYINVWVSEILKKSYGQFCTTSSRFTHL